MKILPPGLSFLSALQYGYAGRIESSGYTQWVKTLPCCCGGGHMADDPHHPKLDGFAVAASKVPDIWVIPLARECHDALHHDTEGWERAFGPQWIHLIATLTQAFWEGRLRWIQ